MSPIVRRSALYVAAFAVAALAAPQAHAQYFGQNKVQYRTFDFRILRTPHFDIYFYPEEEAAARDASRMAERWYARYSRILDHEFEARQPVILYASSPEFQQTAALQGEIGEGTGGVTEVFKQRVILPFAGPYAETDHVLGHELVHAFQYDITGLGRAGGGLEAAAARFNAPLWFIEGMAEYLSIGPVDPNTSMWLRDAALTNTLPNQAQLNYDPRFFPYRWGQALLAYVGGRWGDAAIGQILKQVGQGVPYQDAFERILNSDLDQIIKDWQDAIRRTYLPLLTQQREARETATPLVINREKRGGYNVSPSVSPDGRQFAFLSTLNLLDIQLYLGDAETGRVERRLVKGTALDPHFGSLRFINSSGAWSPDQRRFAFSALRKAHDVVVLLDIQSARIIREFSIPGVGEISNPTFTADGNTVVVSGLKGGISDLYAVDLNTGQTRQLTNDKVAQMQPAFSPDGRTLAYVTDAGTDVGALTYGNYRLALMDWASGQTRLLPGTESGKNINPQWAREGVYFISDRTGIPNIYRVDLSGGSLSQVTKLFTGVSGITNLSPAITSATRADRLLFTVYERNAYNIYSISAPAQLAGTTPETPQLAANGEPLPELLPPSPRPTEPAYNRVYALIHDAAFGRPEVEAPATYAVAPYRPRLSLDYLGHPSLGAAAASGPYARGGVYGGVGGIFSDVLGYHTIYGTIQAQGQLDEIGGNVVYLNQQHRWNWGASVQRLPYIAGGIQQGFDSDGNLHDQLLIFRYFDNSAYGILQYPFSRVQRVELAGGVRRISQDIRIRDYTYDPSGSVVIDYQETKQSLGSWNLAEGTAALVYDNALDGYTSPMAGQRYRFEVAPTVGDLHFNSVTADFRRYFLARPVTLAFRALHFGRYGRDEAVPSAVFLGYPSLLRGYGYTSVQNDCLAELESTGTGKDCEIFQDLFGSRMAVTNLELRLPLIRNPVRGSVQVPPVEVFSFLDAGAAWGKLQGNDGSIVQTHLNFERGLGSDFTQRGFLTSGGVGARMNLFGYIIVEADYVNAFERPTHWHWQFSFQPGF